MSLLQAVEQMGEEIAAQVEVMRCALRSCDSDWADGCYGTATVKTFDSEKVKRALSITPSDALREVKARTLEEAMKHPRFADAWWVIDELRKMAAAIRKGE